MPIRRGARRRIFGEIQTHHETTLSLTSIRRILARAGIPPAPDRRLPDDQRQWLIEDRHDTVATDFYTVAIRNGDTGAVIATAFVLFLIHLESRRVHLAGITEHPDALWMA